MEGTSTEDRIKGLLKRNPRGLTISEISTLVGINRNAAAKYLKVLETKGEVDQYRIGTGKVFVLSHRLPVSSLFELAASPVCIFDENRILTFANRNFLRFFESPETSVIHRKFEEIEWSGPVAPEFKELIGLLPVKTEETRDISFRKEGVEYTFRVRMIPVTFEDGVRGTIFVFDDITREHRYLKNLEFLAKTSAELAGMGEDENMYQYIADRVAELEPDAHINVCAVDPENKMSVIKAISGNPEMITDFNELFSPVGNPLNVSYNIGNVPIAIEFLQRGELLEAPNSLYLITCCSLPESLCNEIQEKLKIDKNYVMGCTCRGGIFGGLVLIFRQGDELKNRETLEAFAKQAGVTLQRKHMRMKLAHAEKELTGLRGKKTVPSGSGLLET